MVLVYVRIWCLVCQTLSHVLLVLGVCRLLEVGAEGVVVVLQHLENRILLVDGTFFVVDAVIKNGGYVIFRKPGLEDAVVFNGLRDVFGSEDSVELAVHAENRPFGNYLVGYCGMMLFALIEGLGLVLYFKDVPVIHHCIVFRLLFGIVTDLLYCIYLCLMEGNHLSQLVFGHIILPLEIESEDVAVRNTVSKSVLVEHVAENDLSGDFLLRVLLEDRGASKSEENCPREGVFDAEEHLSEHSAMALVDDEHDSLGVDLVYR